MTGDQEAWTLACIEGLSALIRWQAARTEYFNIGGTSNFPDSPEVVALKGHLGNLGAFPEADGEPVRTQGEA
jgi:hypothetical protein